MDSIFKASFTETELSQGHDRKASELPPLVHIESEDHAYEAQILNLTQWSNTIIHPNQTKLCKRSLNGLLLLTGVLVEAIPGRHISSIQVLTFSREFTISPPISNMFPSSGRGVGPGGRFPLPQIDLTLKYKMKHEMKMTSKRVGSRSKSITSQFEGNELLSKSRQPKIISSVL
ncbi:hypothetical protein GDO81_003167 [Engystomops pustulosus]|uniref:Uncharacterized protein n=1 Tax=Engystomops pustulosus TaxID=76066 RepID=A0AAV6ZUT9_ENGPU|nr:hypothetical protein GDO81_003167 [Engystomops pustulosus]